MNAQQKLTSIRTTLLLLALFCYGSSVLALPSFARQTGEACTACHIQTMGSTLTPRGRKFKLRGFVEGSESALPPLSLTVQSSSASNLNSNIGDINSLQGSLFYAGRVYGKVGAYIEGQYVDYFQLDIDFGSLDKVDIRFTNQFDLAGQHIDYGISVNNEPGVTDLWNTNAVWGGYEGRTLADRRLHDEGGATLYAMINNSLYLEAGAYAALPKEVQNGIGRSIFYPQTNGVTPYWRIALQHEWKGHYVSLGHFGLQANLLYGTDIYNNYYSLIRNQGIVGYSDLGVDATYQYLANPEHIFELKGQYVHETKKFSILNEDSLINDQFTSVKSSASIVNERLNIQGTYTWHQTLGLSVGYQQNNFFTNANSSISAQLSYTPFGKQHSFIAPWFNPLLTVAYYKGFAVAVIRSPGIIVTPDEVLIFSGRLAF